MQRRSALLMLFILVLLLSLVLQASAAVVYVRTDGSDDNTGSSWETAKRTVQAAIDKAAAGDEVWTAAGTYYERISLKDGVSLYGGFLGGETALRQRDWTANTTTLDGEMIDVVVTVLPGSEKTTRIDGFKIVNGKADYGGGIYCKNCSPVIANNFITMNETYYGGGIYCYYASPTISGNTISDNKTYDAGGGAGIYCQNSSARIQDNVVTDNYSGWAGGGIYVVGGNLSVMVTGNTVANNDAVHYGGGIYAGQVRITITGNTITGNSSDIGGGIECVEGFFLISDNMITGNSALELGGGIDGGPGRPTIMGNTITGNSAGNGGGIYCWYADALEDNIICGNVACEDPMHLGEGGGVFLGAARAGTPVRHNIISGNRAERGGGMALQRPASRLWQTT